MKSMPKLTTISIYQYTFFHPSALNEHSDLTTIHFSCPPYAYRALSTNRHTEIFVDIIILYCARSTSSLLSLSSSPPSLICLLQFSYHRIFISCVDDNEFQIWSTLPANRTNEWKNQRYRLIMNKITNERSYRRKTNFSALES